MYSSHSWKKHDTLHYVCDFCMLSGEFRGKILGFSGSRGGAPTLMLRLGWAYKMTTHPGRLT